MALVDPNIAMSFKPTTEYQPRNVLAEYAQLQQIQGGQMQLEKVKRDEEALTKMMQAITAKGGPEDPLKAADEMIKSRIPEFMSTGIALRQKYQDTQQARAALGLPPIGAAAKPTIQPNVTPGALGSGTFDPMAFTAPTNALAATTPTAQPVAPTNALAATPSGRSPEELKALEMMLSPNAAVAKAGEVAYENLVKLSPDIKTMTALGYPATVAGFEAYRAAQRPETLTFEQRLELARTGRAPRAERAPRTQVTQLQDGSIALVNLDTGQVSPALMAGQQVRGKGSKDKDATVSEQQAAYNTNRVLTAASKIAKIVEEDPSALKPNVMEALPSSVGMSGTANLARSANRQIVNSAQRDALDALLYLATGAAYNKEQLEGQTEAYIPSFTDKADTVKAKQQRMAELIQSAKIRAGKAWTPEMEAASQVLINPTAAPKTPAKPAGGTPPLPPGFALD